MLKKVGRLLCVAGLLVSLCACSAEQYAVPERDEAPSAVPEAPVQPEADEMSEAEIDDLANRLLRMGETVFWWYHSDFSEELGMDIEAEPLEIAGGMWQKVGRFGTMAELKAATEDIFTLDFCKANFYDKIEQYEKFKELDGVLYHNANVGGMGWIYTLPKAYVVEAIDSDTMVLSAICDGLDPRSDTNGMTEYIFEVVLVRDGDKWKLNSYYNHTPEGYLGDLAFRDGTVR